MLAAPVRLVAAAVVAVALIAGCTNDEPATALPCEFWVSQFRSGGVDIDEVPEEFRPVVRGDATCDEIVTEDS